MFISDIFSLDNNNLTVKWHLSSNQIINFLDKHKANYYKGEGTIGFVVKESDFSVCYKIRLNKNESSIKSLSFEIASNSLNYKSLFQVLVARINQVMGSPVEEKNPDNIDLVNDDHKYYQSVIWENCNIIINLFLSERFGFYWVLDIKRNITG
jgi:hypothetical protein